MIRKKYFIPFVIIILCLVIFRYFFLDNLVRVSLQRSLSKANFVVQIYKLKLHIFEGKMVMSDVVVFSKKAENATAIEKILFDLNTTQLLKARFVVTNMQVSGMKIVPRSMVYYEEEKPKKDNFVKKEAKKIANNTMAYYSVDSLKDRLGVDSFLDLSKAKFAKVLESELNEIRVSYDEMQKVLASADLENNLKELESAIKKLESNRPTDFMKLPEYSQEIARLEREYKKVKAAYDAKADSIVNFNKKIELAKKNVEYAGKLDVGLINSKLAFVEDKKRSFVSDIIGEKVNGYIEMAKKGIEVIRVLKGDKKKKKLFGFKGVDVAFPVKDSYPVFYINNITIDGVDKNGNAFKGIGKDITYKQSVRNLPTTLELFQNLGPVAFFAKLTIDLRDDVYIAVNGYMNNQPFKSVYWDPSQIPLQIRQGKYDVNFNGGFDKDKLFSKINLKTNGLNLEQLPAIESKSVIERFLFESLGNISSFIVSIDLDGDKLTIDTNVDEYMAKATQEMIDKQIESIKQNLSDQWKGFVKEQEDNFKKELSRLSR